MFVGLLGEIVRATGPSTEADPVGVYATLLAGFGALIGDGPRVQIGSSRHPLLIWVLLFGRTGSGRKGEATATASQLLRELTDFTAISVTGLSSGEGLIERVRDTESDEDPGGVRDKRLFVVESEFATVMARAKREGSTLSGVLREAWEGGSLGLLNRRMLRASSSHIAVVGHVTPKEFRRRLAETDLAGGLYNRFLPLYVDRSKSLPIPERMDPHVLKDLLVRLQKAVSRAQAFREIGLSAAGDRRWRALYDEFDAIEEEDFGWSECTRRAKPYCRRVAALLAVADARDLVGPDDLDAAAALVRYSIASAKFVLDGRDRDPRMDRLRRAIDSSETGLSRSQVSGMFSRNLSKEVLDAMLDALTGTGEYQEIRTSTGGRPATRFARLPPAYSSFFVAADQDDLW